MDVLGTPTLQKAQRLELGTSGVCVYIIIEYIYILYLQYITTYESFFSISIQSMYTHIYRTWNYMQCCPSTWDFSVGAWDSR